MPITRRALLAAVVAGAIPTMMAACAKTDDGADGVWQPTDQSVEGLLALLPDAAGNSYPVVNLYARAAAAASISRPASANGARDYAQALTAKPGGPSLAGSTLTQGFLADPSDVQKRTGFGLADIDADAEISAAPAHYVAARGHFDRSAVDSALRSDPDWKSKLTTSTYHDTKVYRWLDDNKTDVSMVGTGLFTNIGGSRRFALPDDSTFLYANTDSGIHKLLDVSARQGSLAARPDYVAAARALDANRAYSAMFVPTPLTVDDMLNLVVARNPSPAQLEAIRKQLTAHTLVPYQLAAVGVTFADGHLTTVIAVVNPDPKTASANVQKLTDVVKNGKTLGGDRWSASYSIGTAQAWGNVTVATLRPVKDAIGQSWPHLVQDTLLLCAKS
jgi:hypothetical protein